jgi:hypothetical protein
MKVGQKMVLLLKVGVFKTPYGTKPTRMATKTIKIPKKALLLNAGGTSPSFTPSDHHGSM